jgi:hypothetical protein
MQLCPFLARGKAYLILKCRRGKLPMEKAGTAPAASSRQLDSPVGKPHLGNSDEIVGNSTGDRSGRLGVDVRSRTPVLQPLRLQAALQKSVPAGLRKEERSQDRV